MFPSCSWWNITRKLGLFLPWETKSCKLKAFDIFCLFSFCLCFDVGFSFGVGVFCCCFLGFLRWGLTTLPIWCQNSGLKQSSIWASYEAWATGAQLPSGSEYSDREIICFLNKSTYWWIYFNSRRISITQLFRLQLR